MWLCVDVCICNTHTHVAPKKVFRQVLNVRISWIHPNTITDSLTQDEHMHDTRIFKVWVKAFFGAKCVCVFFVCERERKGGWVGGWVVVFGCMYA